MISLVRRLFIALILLVGATPALAADIQFFKGDDGKAGYIAVSGDIEQGDADKFRKLAAGSLVDMVFLSSQGGSLSEAFEIGRIITVSSYATVVMDDNWCSSACALIWIAGSKRYAQPKAHIGFHAGYTMDGGKPITSGMANALIGRYLTQLNLPTDAIVFATSATPEKMAWLDIAHPGNEGISYTVFPSLRASDANKPPPPITPIAKSASSTSALTERNFGKWKVVIEKDFYGIATLAPNCKGLLAYICPIGKNCRYAAQVELTCSPGDQYTVKYQVDGYSEKSAEVTCDTDGKSLYFNNTAAFGADISGEVGITFINESDKGLKSSIRFNLVGLEDAISALRQAGYIVYLDK